MGYGAGIDVGTATATVAVLRGDGTVEVVDTVPAAVFARADGSFAVGDEALALGADEPRRLALHFWRDLGLGTPLTLGVQPFTPAQLAARLVAALLAAVTEREGGAPAAVVLTHPASWADLTLDALRRALVEVGVDDVRLLAGTEAAALHHVTTSPLPIGARVAVYDLGGGTFDAAVLERTEAGFATVGSPYGIERLGTIDLDDLDGDALAAALAPTASGLRAAIADAGTDPGDLDAVLLVGGAGRLASGVVGEVVGRPVEAHPDAVEAVARGAAVATGAGVSTGAAVAGAPPPEAVAAPAPVAPIVALAPPLPKLDPKGPSLLDRLETIRDRRQLVLVGGGVFLAVVLLAAVASALFGGGGDAGTDDNAEIALDPAILDAVQVGAGPLAPVEAGGYLWFTNRDSGTVSVVDPGAVRLVSTLDLGVLPAEPVDIGGVLWFANTGSGTATAVEATSRTVLATVPVVDDPSPPTMGGGLLWFSSNRTGSLVGLDPAALVPAVVVPVGPGPSPVVASGGLLWVGSGPAGTLTAVDPVARAVVATVEVGDGPGTPVEIDGRLWVPLADGVAVVDPDHRRLDGTVNLGRAPRPPVELDGLVWIADDELVSVVDPDDLDVVDTVVVGAGPTTPAAVGDLVWISNARGGTVSVVDPATGRVLTTVRVGSLPAAAVESDGLVWIANGGGRTVTVVDPGTRG